jgi:hypothetical protein
MVTSNHIHLLVYDKNGRDTVAKSMQLIAARTGQEYNGRKVSPPVVNHLLKM